MATRDIKTRFVLEGEQSYKRAMSDAASAIKVLNSEQRLAKAEFEATGDAQQYAADQARILKEKIEQQKRAVEAAETALKKLTENGIDKHARQTEAWKTKLNNAKTELLLMQTELNSVSDKMTAVQNGSDEQLGKISKGIDLQNTINAIDNVTRHIETIIKTAAKAAKAVWDMGVDAGQWADNLATMANEAGVDPATYQSWQYASRFIDTSVDDIVKSWKDLDKHLNTDKTGDDFREFGSKMAKLGIGVMDASGKVKSGRTVFWQAIDALHNMGDETAWAASAMDLFGNDWRKLNPLITAGSKAYEDKANEGRAVAVVSNENVAALAALDDAVQDMGARFDKLKYDTLAEMAPTFQKVAEALSTAITALNEFVQSEEGQAALQGLNEALSGLIKSFLGEDNGQDTFASIVNTAKEAVSGFTGALEWIKDHGNSVAGIIKAMAGAWVALKVTKGALEMFQIGKGAVGLGKGAVNGTKNLFSRLFGSKGASAESLDDVAQAFNDTAERFSDTADAFESAADSAKQSAEAAKSSSEAAKSASESASSASEAASSSSEAASSSSESASSSSQAAESASNTASSNASAAESSAQAASSSADAAASSAEAAGNSDTAAGNSEAAAAASGDAASLSAAAADQAALTAGSAAEAANNSLVSAAASGDAARLSAGAASDAALAAGSAADATASSALTAGSAADASLSALTAAGDSVLSAGRSAAAAIESADAAASSALASGSALDTAISAAEAAATSIESAANSAAAAAESAMGAAVSRTLLEEQLAGAAAARSLAEAAAARAVASADAAALSAGGAAGMSLLGGGGNALLNAGGGALLGSGANPLALPAAGGSAPSFAPTLGAGIASASELLGGLAVAAGFTYAVDKAVEARRGDQSKLVGTAEHLAAATETDKALKDAFEEFVKTQREMEEAEAVYYSGSGNMDSQAFEDIIVKANEASEAFLKMKDSEKVLDAYNSWRDEHAINFFDWILPDNWEELGLGATDGLNAGVEQGLPDVETAGADIADTLTSATMDALDEHSPSKVMETIGGNAAVGLANGIYDRGDEAIRAAQWLADSVTNIVQSALQIHSPSRVFERLGAFTGQGFAAGIESSAEAVSRAVGTMIGATTKRPAAAYGGVPVSLAGGAAGRAAGSYAGAGTVHVTMVLDDEVLGDVMAPIVNDKIGAKINATRR